MSDAERGDPPTAPLPIPRHARPFRAARARAIRRVRARWGAVVGACRSRPLAAAAAAYLAVVGAGGWSVGVALGHRPARLDLVPVPPAAQSTPADGSPSPVGASSVVRVGRSTPRPAPATPSSSRPSTPRTTASPPPKPRPKGRRPHGAPATPDLTPAPTPSAGESP